MDLTEQLRIGQEAENFQKYIEENTYFKGLLDRLSLEYAKQILDLDPQNAQEFSTLRNQMTGIGNIINAVKGDIYLGQRAYEQLNGISEEPKGLL